MGRHWLFLPDLFPHSVVSFYWKDDRRAPGRSWRIRDYSSGVKREYGPTHFDLTHEQILARARWEGSAETIGVDDPYWAKTTIDLNRELATMLTKPAQASPGAADASAIPILDEAALRRLRSGKALERMLTSPNSEDWVSWTVFRTLQRRSGWWPALLSLADLLDLASDPTPSVHLWRQLPSPLDYERASRARMAASSLAAHRERARDPKPVEGNTEVDAVIEGPQVLWFVEAKLHSDLTPNTTYDPDRNQLVRNIDVLLDQAQGRRAIMSMAVLDRRADRFYTQLVARYRADPGTLHALLPHRRREQVDAVARDLRVFLWEDLLALFGDFEPAGVCTELRRRLGRTAAR